MAAKEQRTEQPTQRRLEKARREGNFPSSRELVSAIVFLAAVWVVTAGFPQGLEASKRSIEHLLRAAFEGELTPAKMVRLCFWLAIHYLPPFALAGLFLAGLAVLASWLSTGMGLAWKKLIPQLARLDPVPRLRRMPSQNLSALLEALLVLPAFGLVLYLLLKEQGSALMSLPLMPYWQGAAVAGRAASELLWKAAFVFVAIGLLDYYRQRKRWMAEMRMTRQEVREEHKEVEGNPLIRMRIRRLQRELRRRRMMQQVPKATAVIVNPTHYAVAIRYQMGSPGAPRVVAKGKNWLARRIREIAVRHQVPVVENAPLAQALYASAEVGQEIPVHLYQAVAEILAYIYRLMRGRLPG